MKTATNSDGYATLVGATADPVVLTVIGEQLFVLLVPRVSEPYAGMHGLPGGFVDFDQAGGHAEHPRQAALRKLAEKTGLSEPYVEEIGVFAAPGRDPRGLLWSVAYLALVPASELPDDSDAAWHPVDDLPPLAFDHADIIAAGLELARGKLWLSNIAVGLLPAEFTFTEARRVFTAISGITPNPRNFGRDLNLTGLVEPGDGPPRRSGPGPGANASVWRFRERTPAWGRAYTKRMS
ncbi:NUDIX hydrolase [Paraconexibacter sp. AEG42_29]